MKSLLVLAISLCVVFGAPQSKIESQVAPVNSSDVEAQATPVSDVVSSAGPVDASAPLVADAAPSVLTAGPVDSLVPSAGPVNSLAPSAGPNGSSVPSADSLTPSAGPVGSSAPSAEPVGSFSPPADSSAGPVGSSVVSSAGPVGSSVDSSASFAGPVGSFNPSADSLTPSAGPSAGPIGSSVDSSASFAGPVGSFNPSADSFNPSNGPSAGPVDSSASFAGPVGSSAGPVGSFDPSADSLAPFAGPVGSSVPSGLPSAGFQSPVGPLVQLSQLVPLIGDFSAEDFSPLSIEVGDSSEEINIPLTHVQARMRLVRYMNELEREIAEDILENDFNDVQSSLFKLNTQVLPRIVSLSDAIYNSLNGDSVGLQREIRIQETLKQDVARIRYKAGARKCHLADEAFYGPSGRCVVVGSTDEKSNPCAGRKDQVLYEGANNKAVCDCIDDERNLVFSNVDGQCYSPNTQGPCQKGDWLVLNQGKAVCEPTVADCPADGQHVYWTHDRLVAKPQCYKLGARGPCLGGHVLGRNRAGALACIAPQITRSPVQLRPSCRHGSLRAQSELCPL